jgi:hypothetical protein
MKMKGDYLEEICDVGEGGLRAGYPLAGLTYVNSDKAPTTGTSVADSLIMRNLTRFLGLGIARFMGKKTHKSDKTISYQRALHGVAALSPTADRPTQRLAG